MNNIFLFTHPRLPKWLRRAGLNPLPERGAIGIHFLNFEILNKIN